MIELHAARLLALALAALAGACHEPPVPADPAPMHSSAVKASVVAASTPAHPARIAIVPDGEPGQALDVSGIVYLPDGESPAPGVTIYVYQTDITGVYGTGDFTAPRLRGWMVSDDEGRYSFRTIRPEPYPERTIPAHVHVQLWSERWPAQYAEEIHFEEDPLLSTREREHSRGLGRFGGVKTLAKGADGVLRCTHDLRLKPTGDTFEEVTIHGQRDEPRR